MITKGWGPWKQEWYSVCSAHLNYDSTCPRCLCGAWAFVWKVHVNNLTFKFFPKLWIWWINKTN
jgi:hypothetical protein